MIILATDTCAKIATASIQKDGELLALCSFHTDTHSATLLPMIENLLETQNLSVNDIDLFAVSTGPGSFTGVRIGVSTIKGLAFLNNTPCIGISSLEGMAENFRGINGLIIPCIDARRDTVYSAVFRSTSDGIIERITDDTQINISDLVSIIKQYENDNVYFCGDAYEKMKSWDITPSISSFTPMQLRIQSAYGVGCVAYNIWNKTEDKSQFTDVNLNPVYHKKTQAERELEEGFLKDKIN